MAKSSASKVRFWEQHVQGWKKSTLSQADYCRHHSLIVSTFRYWVAKDKKKAPSLSLVQVPLKWKSPLSSKGTPSLVLVVDKYKIEIEDTFSPSTLNKVIRTLEEVNVSSFL